MVLSQAKISRPGVSLTEVLVAMFVMALGMIALMTLFPLGAMQVGQALRDDRASQLARQADGYMRQWWRHEICANPNNTEYAYWTMDDPNLVNRIPIPNSQGYSLDVFIGSTTASTGYWSPVRNLSNASQLPSGSNFPAAATPVSSLMLTQDSPYSGPSISPAAGAYEIQARPTQQFGVPSYPVMLDAIGFENHPGLDSEKIWVARNSVNTNYGGLLIPRRTVKAAVSPVPYTVTPPVAPPSLVSPFDLGSLTDDMSFTPNGAPQGGTVIGRQGRFTWSAVIQRPRNDVRTVADLSVLIYDQRPVLPQPRDEYVGPPDVAATTGTRTITVTLPNRGENQSVLIRRGGWVIDGTIDVLTATNPRRNFIPYRISGITETATNTTATALAPLGTTTFDIDLETPLKADLTTSSQLYFLAGLIEVFQRPQLRPDVNY